MLKNNHPVISVIIPCYEACMHVNGILKDLQSQTFTDFEAVFVDDCSKDTTRSLLEEATKHDDRIVVCCTKRNGGAGVARNVGLRVSRGRYIAFIDVDDSISANYLEHLLESAELNAADVVQSAVSVSQDDFCFDPYGALPDRVLKNDELIAGYLDHAYSVSVWGKLFSADLARSVEYPEIRLNEDFFYLWEVCRKASRLSFAPDSVYTYSLCAGEHASLAFDKSLTMIDYLDVVKRDSADTSYEQAAERHIVGGIVHTACMLLDNAKNLDTDYIREAVCKLKRASAGLPDNSSMAFLVPERGLSVSALLSNVMAAAAA